MKRTLLLLIPITLIFVSCGMSPDYNLEFDPPADNAQIEDVFPAKISGEEGTIENPSYGGILMSYGKNGSIYSVKLEDNEEANAFFKKYLLEDFKDLSNNFSGNINGQFYAQAHGNSKNLFGWVNSNYCFVMEAENEDDLDTLIESFKFISK